MLKVRALTEQSYVDELEVEDEGIAELLLDDNSIADVARALLHAWRLAGVKFIPPLFILRSWDVIEEALYGSRDQSNQPRDQV